MKSKTKRNTVRYITNRRDGYEPTDIKFTLLGKSSSSSAMTVTRFMLTRSEQHGNGTKTPWCSSTLQHATIADLSRSSKDSAMCAGLAAISTYAMNAMKITNAGYAPSVSARGTHFSACLYPRSPAKKAFAIQSNSIARALITGLISWRRNTQ